MSSTIHYTKCPVCGSAEFQNVLAVKDHSVTEEVFQVAECSSCSLRFTQDVPDANDIIPYYKSENYISHTETSKGLINRIYKVIRKRTLRGKRKLVKKTTGLDKGYLLDLGSGTGAFVNEMKQQYWEVTGLEPDADARERGKQMYHIELANTNGFYQLPVEGFDAITLWHVLEHVHDLQGYIAQLKLLLKETGRMFIAVPNFQSLDAAIYRENWAAYDVPRHLYHFSPRSMEVLMEKHGLKILQYNPMWYDSFYVSLLSSKYKRGSTNLFASVFNGIRSNLKAIGDVKKCSSVIYIIGK